MYEHKPMLLIMSYGYWLGFEINHLRYFICCHLIRRWGGYFREHCNDIHSPHQLVTVTMSETPAVLPGNSDHDKLQALANLTYKQQAIWFLNGFWEQYESEAECLWKYVEACSEIDIEHHEEGSGLDEVNAHRFLEKFGETLTVRELRSKLRSTGALEESERPKTVPLTHYLLFKYNVDWHKLVNASQGDNSEEIAKAQKMLEEVQAAFRQSESRHSEAKSTAASAAKSEAEAVAKENEARTQEAPFKAAQEEVESALAEVKSQEDEYQGKIADCERRSEEGGGVQKNKAKAELAQLKAEDPLPLSRAKITLEAARKRAEKTRAPFEAATKQAEAARAAATADRQKADAAKQEAERALQEAERRLKEAEDYLEEIKSRPGCAMGALWWIDRELHEQKAYMPESRGGYRK